ncbi:Cytochrome c oxidase assembly factor 6 [Neolecta irregularis DAH-3]|uniref:Cytochrome c oxidase assembly factor 6 n=1 Tax=Neolecta irregularis (strain DAH-3) TaxID=1198029 RepID=A0A1U7LP74_NEOID|nr:Cytochrome c oxidase assembly factor 6 [Neolecta irregularis DAH-3]|eukprot:OLL24455.1 Cytochrome c oxidase assembly factor 6 [Neolecta irregularis DAH-3]
MQNHRYPMRFYIGLHVLLHLPLFFRLIYSCICIIKNCSCCCTIVYFCMTPPAEAPSRNQRKRCWDARDLFFECLDKNGIVSPATDLAAPMAVCGTLWTKFKEDCQSSWVEYFCKKRVIDEQRRTMLEQAAKS